MVLHAAAGGVVGTYTSSSALTVHCSGAALQLCPLAYLQGVRYFDLIVEQLADAAPGGLTFGHCRAALREIDDLWVDYQRVVRDPDRPVAQGAHRALSPGRRHWSGWTTPLVPGLGRAPPLSTGDISERPGRGMGVGARSAGRAGDRGPPVACDGLTQAMPGASVDPNPTARWLPASGFAGDWVEASVRNPVPSRSSRRCSAGT